MPGLNILLVSAEAERLRGALMLAMTHRALGGDARLFLQMEAVRLLAAPVRAPQDIAHQDAGFPSLATLLNEALADGIAVIACQSGLALCAIKAADLDPRIETGGLLSFMAAIDPADRLLSL
ncbi:MAG: DsrE family protein [Sphingobium sp.]